MTEEVHHHHYHHRRGSGCLLNAVIAFIVLAVIGSMSQNSPAFGGILGGALVVYLIYRFITGGETDDSENPDG